MISLIICARTGNVSDTLLNNVESTIGCDHEWVVIDNSRHQYNIFQAYNIGVARAKGDILCFMHDDILYHTNNWGTKIEDLFMDDSIGQVGAAIRYYSYSIPRWQRKLINLFIR